MTLRASTWLMVFFVLAAAVGAAQDKHDQKRPEAPKGFKWQELEEIQGAVLLPDGWHFSKVSNEDTLAYRITKEDLNKHRVFLTGLTINVTRDVQKKTPLMPSAYAVYFVDKYTKQGEIIVKPKMDQVGPLKRVTSEVEKKLPLVHKDELFHLRLVTFANDDTGTLYVLIFGAPKDEWKEAWKIGRRLFNPIVFNRNV